MLIRDGAVLAERRKLTKKKDPGVLALPGGHVEPGEELLGALHREAREEMAIELVAPAFLCTLLHQGEETLRLSFYAVHDWRGDIKVLEAAALEWIRLDRPERFDMEVDHVALAEYRRIYG